MKLLDTLINLSADLPEEQFSKLENELRDINSKTESRIIKHNEHNKSIKGIIGLEHKPECNKHNGSKSKGDNCSLKVIGPAAYRYMEKKFAEVYEKITNLFPETNNTSDGIAVTRAAIKVLTKFEELPSNQEREELETREAEKIEKLMASNHPFLPGVSMYLPPNPTGYGGSCYSPPDPPLR